MDDAILILTRCRMNTITMEVCHGEIPDVCRLLMFDTIRELELPDAKASDEDFEDWLGLYRHSNAWAEFILLKETQCD